MPAKPAGWSVAAKRLRNFQQHTFQIFPDIAVFKAKHRYTCATKKHLPILIMRLSLFVVVRCAVEFDRQLLFRAVKVEYVWTDAVLPAKLSSSQLSSLKKRPEMALFRS